MITGTVVTDLLRNATGRVVGVRVDRDEGELEADVVLLADGINSPLAAKTGFRPEARPEHVALAVKEVIELPAEVIEERFSLGPEEGVTTEIMGETSCGMNGVAILYTNRNSLSIATGANLAEFSKSRVRPYEMIESFKEHPMVAPLLKGGKSREYIAHWLPEGGFDHIPELCGDGFLIAGDSAMLFNTLHREGSNLAMTSGRLAAEAILEARKRRDFTRGGLGGYVAGMQKSYVLKDLKKYRRFNPFLAEYKEIFTSLPRVAGFAAREMLSVDGASKNKKQRRIWSEIRKHFTIRRLLSFFVGAWRSIG